MAGKNKRGFLLGEYTLKLIVAIICILVLAYLLFRLYASFSNTDNLKKAQASLDAFYKQLVAASVLKDGESISYVFVSPISWVFISYPRGEPDFCGGKSCLCICKAPGIFYTQLQQCNDKGTGLCKPVGYAIRMSPQDSFEIASTGITLKKEAGLVAIIKS